MATEGTELLPDTGRRGWLAVALDKVFLEWSFRSIGKAAYGGMFLGVLWAGTSLITVRPDTSTSGSRFLVLLTFFLDTSFTFLVTCIGLLAGMTMFGWASVGKIISDGRKIILSRYLWAIMLIFISVAVVQYYHFTYNFSIYLGISALTYVIAASFALSGAYHAYWMFGVMRRSERREYYATRNSTTFLRGLFKRVPLFDCTHVTAAFLWALVIVAAALWTTSWITSWTPYKEHLTQAVFATVLSTLFGVWGVARRFLNELRPGSKKVPMYPYWEVDSWPRDDPEE